MRLRATRLMSITAAAVRRLFTPASLFAAGEPGAWYDPSDLTTLFQDAAGTTPVTAVEQPVGLLPDKSKGLVLGSELNDGLSLVANWTAFGTNTVAQDGDAIKITYTTGQSPGGAYSFFRAAGGLTTDLTVGRWYKVSGQAKVNSGSATVQMATTSLWISNAITSTAFVDFTIYFLADNATTNYLSGNNLSAGEELWVRGISVRELPGNHAFQSTAASRPVLSARVNQLQRTEDLSNAYWAATGLSNRIVSGAFTTLVENTATTAHAIVAANVMTLPSISTPSTISCVFKAGTRRYIQMQFDNGVQGVGAVIDTQNWTISALTGAGTITQSSIVQEGTDEYRVTVSGFYTSGTAVVNAAIYGLPNSTQNNVSYTGNGSTIIAGKIDLRVSNDGIGLPAYQRVNTASDYDTTGFPLYLRFDGVDDWLQTGTITPGTDKAQVFAGVRKLSDGAGYGMIAENTTNNGSFSLAAPADAGTGTYYCTVGGTTRTSYKLSTYNAPHSAVISVSMDIAGAARADELFPRVNGAIPTLTAADSADAGTGNFGNNPLYIGRRAGTSLPFNGRLTSLIVRFGPTLTDAQIASTEAWVAGKTGVRLLAPTFDFITTDAGDQITTDAGDEVVTDTYYI